MRKAPKVGPNSGATVSIDELARRLANLSNRVAELERAILGHALEPEITTPPRNPKGRKRKIDHEVVLKRRDRLTYWVERNWPFLSMALQKARTPGQAALALLRAKRRDDLLFMGELPFYSNPERFQTELWNFIRGDRYRGDPRNLAGALAGLPELKPKTSLDLCQRTPCKEILDSHAWRDYLRRRFPIRWKEIKNCKSAIELATILKKTQGQDATYRYLKENPDEAFRWIAKTLQSQVALGHPPDSDPDG